MIDESVMAGLAYFQHLNSAARKEIAARSVLLQKDVGEVLWCAGDTARGLVVLISGRVRIVRVGKDGRRQVVHREGPGTALGEVPLLDGGRYPATAEVEEAITAILVTPDAFHAAMVADPAMPRALLAGLASRVRHLVDRLEAMALLNVRSRLARYLLARADAHPERAFRLGLSQAALAEELGTVREVIVRNLSALRRQGVLHHEGHGRYRIVNRPALLALADY